MINKVLEFIRLRSSDVSLEIIELGFNGYDVNYIQKSLNCSRETINSCLKTLVKKNKIVKIKSKPTKYFDKETIENLFQINLKSNVINTLNINTLNLVDNTQKPISDVFETVIGAKLSLKQCVEKAKASMIYPPHGLHTLLHGPTGVGKTMFAEMMYEYAKSFGVLNDNSKFVVFNCADYADNPQLLLGQLFGYVKGSFTDATDDKKGLVYDANNGILFLDEIHRLSVEGQEMLFLLMDKGIYRRIGDTDNLNKANVLIIGATTANLDESLLATFKRRIPMIIDMPSLSERTIIERYKLIIKFFSIEYSLIKCEMVIEQIVIKALLSYECHGNIGQLKADIKMICARAFLDYRTIGGNIIHVSRNHMSDVVYGGILEWNKFENKYEEFNLENSIVIDGNYETTYFDHIGTDNIYSRINDKIEEYYRKGENISDIINVKLKEYVNNYVKKISKDLNANRPNEKLLSVVNSNVYQVVSNVVEFAEFKINRKISKEVFVAMCLHISSLVENKDRKTIINKEAIDIASENSNEFMVAKIVKKDIEHQLNIALNDDEVFLITMFLCMDKVKNEEKISILVLSHGDGVAKHMVKVTKDLFHCNNIYGLDMALTQNSLDFLEVVEKKVIEIGNSKGILIMVDMGSLISFGEIIEQRTNIKTRTMNMVNTPLLLEATRKSMVTDIDIEQLYFELMDIKPYIAKNNSNILKSKISERTAIIFTCLTGEGTAVKLKKIVQEAIDTIDDYGVTLFTTNKDNIATLDTNNYHILAVVGTINLNLENVPFLSTNEIVVGDGLSRLNKLLSEFFNKPETKHMEISNYMIDNVLSEQLLFLNPTKIYRMLKKIYEKIIGQLQLTPDDKTFVPFVMHCAVMTERAISDKQFCNSLNVVIDDIYEKCQKALEVLEDEFDVKYTDAEISLVADLFRYFVDELYDEKGGIIKND